jgi:hypothetical protein
MIERTEANARQHRHYLDPQTMVWYDRVAQRRRTQCLLRAVLSCGIRRRKDHGPVPGSFLLRVRRKP